MPLSRLFFLVGVLGLALFWGVAAWLYLDAEAQGNWQRVEATVLESGVDDYYSDDSTLMYRARVRYAYTFDGKRYASSEMGGGNVASSDPSDAEREVSLYPEEGSVTAHVNPADPEQAVLKVGYDWWFIGIFVMAGAVFGGLFGSFAIFAPRWGWT